MTFQGPQFTNAGYPEIVPVGKGVRQECIVSPFLFDIHGDCIMQVYLENGNGGISFGGERIRDVCDTCMTYVGSTALITERMGDICVKWWKNCRKESENVAST